MKTKDLDTKQITGEAFGHFVTALQFDGDDKQGYMESQRYAYERIKEVVYKAVSQNNSDWSRWINEKTRYDCGWNSALAELEARLKLKEKDEN